MSPGTSGGIFVKFFFSWFYGLLALVFLFYIFFGCSLAWVYFLWFIFISSKKQKTYFKFKNKSSGKL